MKDPIGTDPDLVDRLLMKIPPQEGWTYAGTVVCTLWSTPDSVKTTVITQGFRPEDWGLPEDSPEVEHTYEAWVISILKMAQGNFEPDGP